MEYTDEKLVADYLAGNEGALAMLISRYLKPIYGFVYRYVGSKQQAQDITQEVFLKVWRNLKKSTLSLSRGFNPKKGSFKTWIFSIAKNTAIDFLRAKKEVVFSELDAPDGENTFADNIVDSSPLPAELIEREDIKQALAGAMEKISPSYRPVLYLRYNDHFTFREIAEILEEPLDTIKSRHRRALIMLKKFFGEH
jgi:RNA polymerase sigma-70 factor (ECF subfamily)